MNSRTNIALTLLLICVVFTSNAQVNINEGLVAWYPFNGNPNDTSGNNHNGELVNGPRLTADRFGNPNSAYHFDGKDDYIRITDNGDFSSKLISLAFWYKTESNLCQNIIAKRSLIDDGTPGGGAQYQFFINHATLGKIASNLVGDIGNCKTKWVSSYIKTLDAPCENRWHFVVVTFDGDEHKLFMDGKLAVSDVTSFNGFADCRSELRVGNWWKADLLTFKGDFDDFRWYNRPLNQQEINSLYNNFQPQGNDFTIQHDTGSTGISVNTIATNYKSINWDFGDGNFSSDASAQHTYSDFGTYTVKMILRSGNCKDTIQKQVALNRPKPPVVKPADTAQAIVLKNVFFDFDGWNLRPASYTELNKLVKFLKDNPTIRIEISAHTDDKGTDEYNNKLSANRAKSVMDYLISQQIDASRLTSKGYGETKPVAPNDTEENRQLNRRVEYVILKDKKAF